MEHAKCSKNIYDSEHWGGCVNIIMDFPYMFWIWTYILFLWCSAPLQQSFPFHVQHFGAKYCEIMYNCFLKWKNMFNDINTEHEENMRVRRTEEMCRESHGVIRIFWHRTCWEHAAYSCQCSEQENGVSLHECPFQCPDHVFAQNRRGTWFHFPRFSLHVLRSEHWIAPAVEHERLT